MSTTKGRGQPAPITLDLIGFRVVVHLASELMLRHLRVVPSKDLEAAMAFYMVNPRLLVSELKVLANAGIVKVSPAGVALDLGDLETTYLELLMLQYFKTEQEKETECAADPKLSPDQARLRGIQAAASMPLSWKSLPDNFTKGKSKDALRKGVSRLLSSLVSWEIVVRQGNENFFNDLWMEEILPEVGHEDNFFEIIRRIHGEGIVVNVGVHNVRLFYTERPEQLPDDPSQPGVDFQSLAGHVETIGGAVPNRVDTWTVSRREGGLPAAPPVTLEFVGPISRRTRWPSRIVVNRGEKRGASVEVYLCQDQDKVVIPIDEFLSWLARLDEFFDVVNQCVGKSVFNFLVSVMFVLETHFNVDKETGSIRIIPNQKSPVGRYFSVSKATVYRFKAMGGMLPPPKGGSSTTSGTMDVERFEVPWENRGDDQQAPTVESIRTAMNGGPSGALQSTGNQSVDLGIMFTQQVTFLFHARSKTDTRLLEIDQVLKIFQQNDKVIIQAMMKAAVSFDALIAAQKSMRQAIVDVETRMTGVVKRGTSMAMAEVKDAKRYLARKLEDGFEDVKEQGVRNAEFLSNSAQVAIDGTRRQVVVVGKQLAKFSNVVRDGMFETGETLAEVRNISVGTSMQLAQVYQEVGDVNGNVQSLGRGVQQSFADVNSVLTRMAKTDADRLRAEQEKDRMDREERAAKDRKEKEDKAEQERKTAISTQNAVIQEMLGEIEGVDAITLSPIINAIYDLDMVLSRKELVDIKAQIKVAITEAWKRVGLRRVLDLVRFEDALSRNEFRSATASPKP